METIKDIQADFEAMDMLKDEDYEIDYKKEYEKVADFLEEACSLIALLEDISGLSKHGYPEGNYEDEVNAFFDKLNESNNQRIKENKKDVKFCENCGKSEYAHLNGISATHCDRFVGDTKIYSEEETCPKCDQHPYSDTDNHCPVCFDEIKENK